MKGIIFEAISNEMNVIEIGDIVDVDMEYHGQYAVRVTEIHDDVSKIS